MNDMVSCLAEGLVLCDMPRYGKEIRNEEEGVG